MDSPGLVGSLIGGATAGVFTDVAFFPIDTIKTRLQAKGGFFSNGGYRGIYKGLGSVTIASAPSASLFFITYDSMKYYSKSWFSTFISNDQFAETLSHIFSSSAGEINACLIRVPAEVIKQRAQIHPSSSSMEIFKELVNNKTGDGLRKNLYRGWSTTIMREIPFTCIQFPLYEYMKKKWKLYKNENCISPWQGAVCGSIAGGIAAAVTTPLDVLKTRLMLHETSISVWKLAKWIYQEEGSKAFIAGISPRIMWISAGGAIFLGVYETVHSMIVK